MVVLTERYICFAVRKIVWNGFRTTNGRPYEKYCRKAVGADALIRPLYLIPRFVQTKSLPAFAERRIGPISLMYKVKVQDDAHA